MSPSNTPAPASNTAAGPGNVPATPINIDDDAELLKLKQKQDAEFAAMKRQLAEKKEREAAERKVAEDQRQKKAAAEEKARAEAEAAKQKQAEDDEEPVTMVKKCRECEAKKKDCRAVVRGGKPMACEACRKSKAKCEKRKKSKITAAIAEGEQTWDSEGEHQDNWDALGVLSQSMMGLTEEVHELRMDIRRGLRLFDRIAIAAEVMANIEPASPNAYTTDEEEEGPVASGSGQK
ncbi:hypothetical protein BV22DRAFT_1052644 [Leucogyrophana mollusca]|uniref:Uncharacterized protein n=1 Tax=Leucogyrophana mollusca TaxID=85980 RepID=A0ACB8AUX3_9AGAM|nr:hypothetical protein BV22DRAFT_1052644 [Leucogyrophana mollusca]